MNDNPHGWPQKTVAEEYNRWGANRVPSRQAMDWTLGTRRTPSPAEDILSDAVGWWDVSTYREGDRILRNLGTGRDLLNLQLGSSLEPNTNDPIYLPVRDEGYVYVPGTSATYISVPDSQALSITGDIDIKVKVKPDSWTSGQSFVISKWSAASQRSYALSIQSNGTLTLSSSSTGNDVNNTSSTVATGFSAGTTSIFDSNAVLMVGTYDAATSGFCSGTYYRCIIQSAYDTTDNTTNRVIDIDFTNLTGSTTSFNATGVGDSGFVNAGFYTLKGRAGEYLSTPNNTALNITTDLDIRAKVALDDWTPSVANTIVSKYGAATLRSYILNVDTSGTLSLTWSADGTNTITSTSTVATGVTDGAIKWVRATLDVDNGASGNDVAFYTSDDGNTWTQLGTTVTTAGVTSVSNNASVLEIGSNTTGTLNPFSGKIYKVIIINGIGLTTDNTTPTTGILIFSANCEQQSTGTITFNAAGTSSIRNGGLFRPISTSSIAVNAPDTSGTTILDGDFDIKARVSFINLAGTATIIQKNTSPYFQVNASGSLQFGYQIRRTPSNDVALTSTATFSFASNTIYWVRATFRQSDKIARFYTAPDSVSPPTSWTQLGSDVQTPSNIRQFDPITTVGTSFEIGSRNNGLNDKLVGSIYRLIIQKTFDLSTDNDSNKIFDMDFSSVNDGLMSFPESASSQTVTLSSGFNFFPMTTNGTNPLVSLVRPAAVGYKLVAMPSRENGGRSLFMLGTDDLLQVPVTNAYRSQLIGVRQGEPFTAIIFYRPWFISNGPEVIFSNGSGNSGIAGNRWFIRFTTATTTGGIEGDGVLQQLNGPAQSVGALVASTLASTEQTVFLYINTQSSSGSRAGVGSSYNTAVALQIGPRDMEFYAAAFFRRVLSVDEIRTLCQYYGTL